MEDIKAAIETVEKVGEEVKTLKADTDTKIVDITTKTETLGEKTAKLETKLTAMEDSDKVNKADIADVRALVAAVGNHPNQEKTKLYDYIGNRTLAYCNPDKEPAPCALKWLEVHNALREGTTSTGGALVPDEYKAEMIDLLIKYGVFRGEARSVPMASDTQIWPKIDSGLTVYSPGENNTITASDPAFSNITLVAKKLATLTKVSSELAEDSALAIGPIIGNEIIRALAKAEDQAGFLGDGSSTYYGYTGLVGAMSRITAGTTDGAATGGNVSASGHLWTDITIGDIRTLISVMPVRFQAAAKFHCSKIFYWQVIVPLVQAAGGLTQTNLEEGPNLRLEGYPVVLNEVMPTATAVSQYCLWFTDMPSGAYFGDRRMPTIDTDDSVYFATDSTGIRGTERFAINVFGEGSDTVPGPICGLYTAAD